MRNSVLLFLACLLLLTAAGPAPQGPAVVISTELGDIVIEVYPQAAPLTAMNFLRYVEAGLYDGSTFHRTVTLANQPDNKVRIEVIQGGELPPEKCFIPIRHETTELTGLLHLDGTVSMARDEPGSASSSFFICINDQPELDYGGRRNPDGQGFAAFGRVISGMDVVRKIQARPAVGQSLAPPVRIVSVRQAGKSG